MRLYSFFWIIAILMLIPLTLSYSELQIYIPFNEGKGDTAKDATGNGHDAVFQGAEWTDGHEGKAVQFGQSYVEIPYPDDPDIFNSNFTFTMWINPPLTGNTWQQLVRCQPHTGTGRNSLFVNNGGFLSWRGFTGGVWTVWSTTPAGLIQADEWTFIAVSGDAKNIRQYIGGENVQEDPFVEGDGGIEQIDLGWEGTQGGEDYAGIIDDFALWNETLSDSDIEKIMEVGVMAFHAVNPAGKLSTRWSELKSTP